MNARNILISGLAGVLIAPAAVHAADAPIRDPEEPRSSRVAQLGFTLPDGWEISRGAMEGKPSRGAYVDEVALGAGAVCQTTVRANGAYRRTRRAPRVVRGRLRDGDSSLFTVAASGKLPGGRWYRGQVGEAAKGSAGVAKLSGAVVITPVPALRASGRPVVLGEFSAIPRVVSQQAPTANQRRRCRAATRPRLGALLERVLPTVRVEAYTAEPDVT